MGEVASFNVAKVAHGQGAPTVGVVAKPPAPHSLTIAQGPGMKVLRYTAPDGTDKTISLPNDQQYVAMVERQMQLFWADLMGVADELSKRIGR